MNRTLRYLLLLFFSFSQLLGSNEARKLSSAVEILDAWLPDQHLYVSGEIPLSSSDLNELEKWLDQNAPNWTIYLAKNSSREKYRGAFGKRFQGVDAVENALEQGLQARTKFGDLRDSKTRLRNGAIFVVFLDERKFSYFGLEHYSRNGAAVSRWQNGLDAKAKSAMRNGGRMIDAVTDTVTSVDAVVKNNIRSRERNLAARAERAKAEVEKLDGRLATLTEKHAALTRGLEGNSDLSRFPVSEFKEQVQALKSRPGSLDPSFLGQNLTRWEDWINDYEGAGNDLAAWEEKLSAMSASSPAGKKSLELALEHLRVARKRHELGDFSYNEYLTSSKNQAGQIEFEDRAARRSAEKRALAFKVGGATGGGALCLLAFAGNRRRRRVKAEAEKLLASRKLEMQETEDRLFELMDRAAVIVGPFDQLENRGYAGETLDLSKKALAKIDEAFVLSSNVQKIIEEGEALIDPGNPFSKSRNVISGGRYERAVDLLDAELNVGLKNVPDLKERSRPGEEIDETFSVPIDEWEDRTANALDAAKNCLDRVETAWSTIVDRNENLNQSIEALSARQEEIQIDQWLRCELLFEEWVPAITSASERATETGKSDPVLALDGDMAEGDRMAGEGHRLLDIIIKFRSEHWTDLLEKEAELDDRNRATVWVDDALADFSKSCERIASESPDGAVSDEIDLFESGLEAFASRVDRAASLVVRADDQAQPRVKSANLLVAKARREIASELKLTDDLILVEESHNPSEFLNQGQLQLDAALASLNLGDVGSAEGFLDEVDALTGHAEELVKASRESLADYHQFSEALWERRAALEERGSRMQREVKAMRTRYAPRALFLDVEAPEMGTFSDAPARLESALKSIVSRLDRAKSRFEAGGLLETRDLLADGRSLAEGGERLCAEVTSRSEELARLEEENADLYRSHRRAEADFREPVGDRRVTRETIKLFEIIGAKLSQAKDELDAPDGRCDPFLLSDELEQLGERIPILRGAIAGDLEQHDRALQLFETVRRNQQEAGDLWKTAESDRIPNSPKTNEDMESIESCHGKLEDVHRDLQIDHADWREIQNDLRTIHLALSESVISLKRELKLARETVRVIESATREVRKAARWSGSYGVRVTGNYGQRALAAANDVMQHGHYQAAMDWAGQARNRARRAIATAEAQEARRRRAEEAARRQRRQAASRSSFGSSRSSIGSSTRSSFGSSSRSSGSSVGRSSFSSGSGMGRSGW